MYSLLILERDKDKAGKYMKWISEVKKKLHTVHFTDEEQAYAYAMVNKVDLFILSDSAEGSAGYDLAEKLRKTKRFDMTFIVLISDGANRELEAYRALKCYHYFTEPVEQEEFKAVLSKPFKYRIEESRNAYIKLNHSNKTSRVKLDNLVWLKIEEKGITMHGKKAILLTVGAHNYALDDLEEILGDGFMRIRQSIIVNKEYIHCVDYTNQLVHLSVSNRHKSDIVLKMGVTYVKKVKEQWG